MPALDDVLHVYYDARVGAESYFDALDRDPPSLAPVFKAYAQALKNLEE